MEGIKKSNLLQCNYSSGTTSKQGDVVKPHGDWDKSESMLEAGQAMETSQS